MSMMTNVASDVAQTSKNYELKTESKKNKTTGKTIGDPQLSQEASDYYEKLKQKYSNMDFILVSKDKKEQAKQQAGNLGNSSKMVVLIDEEKVEKMASDSNYSKQYEAIIEQAASGLSKIKDSITNSGANVKTYGIKINDNGTASYFAVLEKSSKAQKERIEKKAAEKKKQEKAQEKKELTASSIEELINKINDAAIEQKSDESKSDEEKRIGQHIDYRG